MPHFTTSIPNIVELLGRYHRALVANSGRNDSARFDFAAGLQIYEYIFEQLGTSVRGHEQVYEELADGLSPIKYTENFVSFPFRRSVIVLDVYSAEDAFISTAFDRLNPREVLFTSLSLPPRLRKFPSSPPSIRTLHHSSLLVAPPGPSRDE